MLGRIYIRLFGRVQGVGYRFYTLNVAKRLGVKGYARNMSDGSLEIVAEGDVEKLAEFVDEVLKGPPFARIEDYVIKWEKYKGEYEDFVILY